jgi:hypothetical protein
VAVPRRAARRGLPAAGTDRTGADVLPLRASCPRKAGTHAIVPTQRPRGRLPL